MKELYKIIWDESGTKKYVVWDGRKSKSYDPIEIHFMLKEFINLIIQGHCFDYASLKSRLYFANPCIGDK